GLQHLVGHRGGPGDGQKFPARADGHWWSSLSGYTLMLAWRGAISKGPCAVHLCRIVTSPWVLFPDGLGDLTPDRILDMRRQWARQNVNGSSAFATGLDQPQDPHLAVGVIEVTAAIAAGQRRSDAGDLILRGHH